MTLWAEEGSLPLTGPLSPPRAPRHCPGGQQSPGYFFLHLSSELLPNLLPFCRPGPVQGPALSAATH